MQTRADRGHRSGVSRPLKAVHIYSTLQTKKPTLKSHSSSRHKKPSTKTSVKHLQLPDPLHLPRRTLLLRQRRRALAIPLMPRDALVALGGLRLNSVHLYDLTRKAFIFVERMSPPSRAPLTASTTTISTSRHSPLRSVSTKIVEDCGLRLLGVSVVREQNTHHGDRCRPPSDTEVRLRASNRHRKSSRTHWNQQNTFS